MLMKNYNLPKNKAKVYANFYKREILAKFGSIKGITHLAKQSSFQNKNTQTSKIIPLKSIHSIKSSIREN